jgi:hypothetical protein
MRRRFSSATGTGTIAIIAIMAIVGTMVIVAIVDIEATGANG